PEQFDEPDVTVSTPADERRQRALADRVLPHGSRIVDGGDLVDVLLREPERAVPRDGDVPGLGLWAQTAVLRELTVGGELPDAVDVPLRGPEIAVGARGCAVGAAAGIRELVLLD